MSDLLCITAIVAVIVTAACAITMMIVRAVNALSTAPAPVHWESLAERVKELEEQMEYVDQYLNAQAKLSRFFLEGEDIPEIPDLPSEEESE